MNIARILEKYAGQIDQFDLELLVAHVLRKPREFVLAHPEQKLLPAQKSELFSFIKRRSKGEPLAYILGRKEFFGIEFKVNKNVLVPRPETEILVELALKKVHELLRKHSRTIRIADIGTGSGNIVTALAWSMKHKKHSAIELFGTDISKKAIAVARQNTRNHKLSDKIKFFHGNLLEPVTKYCSMFHAPCSMIILANLPYLESEWKNFLESSDTRGLKFEPSLALYAGPDGLDAYRKLASQISALNHPEMALFCEIDHKQEPGIKKIFSHSKKIIFHPDLSGKIRFAEIHF